MRIIIFLIVFGFVISDVTGDEDSNAIDCSTEQPKCPTGQKWVERLFCKKQKVKESDISPIKPRAGFDQFGLCCPIDDTKQCGFRNVAGVNLEKSTVADNEAQFGEFPWMVAIMRKVRDDKTTSYYLCGGSLIHPSIVLTAAHCVQNKTDYMLTIRAGEWNTKIQTELYPHQDRDVAHIVVHEHFNEEKVYNDIALLFLESPVVIEENVRPVCLPTANAQFDFERCIVTGWGKDGEAGAFKNILKKIDLPIVSRNACQMQLRWTSLGANFELHSSFICAGGEINKDACTGDGGSPLVCPIAGSPNQFVQAGIVAWGLGCGSYVPGVYASVASMRPWLDEQLANRKIDSSFYTP